MDGHSLIPLESVNAVEIFTGAKLDDLLLQIRTEVATIVPDVLTAGGRKEIASLAYKVARSKTTIDDAGKTLVAEWKAKSAQVDASRKKARDYLDTLKDEVRKPLDDWEAEQARIEQEAAARLEAERVAAENAAAAEAARIEAERVAAAAAATAELARRAAEIDAREAAIAAKEKVAADALAAEHAAQEAARLERERAASAAAELAAQEKREANKRHCAKVNNAVLRDLVVAGCSDETAKLLVIAIASGKVAHCSIAY
jgi:colicin import membrane protein